MLKGLMVNEVVGKTKATEVTGMGGKKELNHEW